MPVLDCFLLSTEGNILKVSAGDAENTLSGVVNVTETANDDALCINARNFLDGLKNLPEQPITIDTDTCPKMAKVTYMGGEFEIPVDSAEEYPVNMKLDEGCNSISVSANPLLLNVSRAMSSAANDELHPVLNGVYIEASPEDNKITVVGTDGHTLVKSVICALSVSGKCSAIIPKKAATLLKCMIDGKSEETADMRFDNRNIRIENCGYTLFSRLIDGRYPNYNAVIPRSSTITAEADRKGVVDALLRVSVFSCQSSHLCALDLTAPDKLTISSENIDFTLAAKETLPIAGVNKDIRFGVRGDTLLRLLQALDCADEVQMLFETPSRCCVITPVCDENITTLIMPMVLN